LHILYILFFGHMVGLNLDQAGAPQIDFDKMANLVFDAIHQYIFKAINKSEVLRMAHHLIVILGKRLGS